MTVRTEIGRKLIGAATAVLLGTGALVALGSTGAVADTAPVDPAEPATVSADVLPTAQINGVAWNQVIVGTTVYVGGRFTSARPAGSAPGQNESARSNLMAYNLATGVMTSWAPSVNGQVLGLAASPDGSRLYVVGEFTSVNGQSRNRIAAFTTATGALDPTFRPNLDFRARAVLATSSTVYVGGAFNTAAGQARAGLASFVAGTGAVTSWNPGVVDGQVFDLALSPDGSKLVAGGSFSAMGGLQARGMGAVDAVTGAAAPWLVNQVIQNYTVNAAIYSLTSDGDNVYGTGYDFYGPSQFENVFAARWSDGGLVWVNGCYGDTYGVAVTGPVVYAVGHSHNCAALGGNPEENPRSYQYAQAMTTGAGGTNPSFPFEGQPTSKLLHWLPTLMAGTFTGQSQAAWAVEATSEYVVFGGEFPRINNTPQQGLARFAVRQKAPNAQGPRDTVELAPRMVALAPGTVRVGWRSAWDRDNENLTYEVFRGSAVVATIQGDSQWWNRPMMSFIDRAAPPGTTQTYRVRVGDALGNRVSSANVSFAVPAGDATVSTYAAAVEADGASHWWRLGEDAGSTVGYDWLGGDDLVVDASASRSAAGALPEANRATEFPGSAEVPASTTTAIPGPNTFSVEAWFSTTTDRGGKLIGFGNSATGRSSAYDRHVYMDDAGRLVFGAYPNAERRITSPAAYNDGQWHHVVATLGAGGMNLFVDGRRVARRTDTTSGQAYSGFWKVGGDNTWGSSSPSFQGTIDEVAVYPTELTVQQAVAHYDASGRTANVGTRPADAYGAAVFDAEPYSYWRLNEPEGTTTVSDTGPDARTGTLINGTTLGVTGAVTPASGANGAARFDGSDDVIAASAAVDNPTVYSTELWFRTATTRGGKLVGFGREQSGNSTSYDRHVWMQDDGRLVFGTYTGQLNTTESAASYNDDRWHHVVATQGSDGMRLYVDGQLVGTNPQTGAEPYTGYWRLGGDVTWFGASSNFFDGALDEAAVYASVLTPEQVLDHWTKGQAQSANAAPVASFTTASDGLSASFDGTGSTDADGTVSSYAWDFGDGSTGTGATPTHEYADGGTYTTTLTVTDNRGATHTATQQLVITAPPNSAPVAAFTSTTSGLTVSLDASTSSDPDGTVVAYAWDFGDGGTGTGATTSHPYAAAGTYQVTLTVTDDDGATHTSTAGVTVEAPPPNAPPTASFTSTSADLVASVDATTSTDPDGTVVSYAWDFGDGASGTGATTSHPYALGGTYQVTLTVTDDDGATGTITRPVIVTAPTGPTQVASDSFGRTVSGGFGAADVGGSWTPVASPASFSVSGGQGRVVLPTAGSRRSIHLPGVQVTDVDVTAVVSLDKVQTGAGTYVSVVGRRVGAAEYRARAKFNAGGSVTLSITRSTNGVETVLSTAAVPGTFAPGDQVSVRMQLVGTAPTSASAKAWRAGTPEPGTWQLTTSDGATALQGAGSVGVDGYLSGSSTSAPMTLSVDDLRVAIAGGGTPPPANVAPTAAFTTTSSGLVAAFDASTSTDSDGTIASYAWAFGDGTVGSGATTTHAYPSAGSYTATLTVTDDDAATALTTRTVTVVAAPPPGAVVADTFSRSTASGWGSTETGGGWSLGGGAASFRVEGQRGRMSTPAGASRAATATATTTASTDLTAAFAVDQTATGGGTYVSFIGRSTATGDYRARVRVQATGSPILQLSRTVGGTETVLAQTTLAALAITPGSDVLVRLQVEGSGTTALRARAWARGTAEPSAWAVSTSDSVAGLQGPGATGLAVYVSGSATAAQVVTFDDLLVRPLG